MAPVNPASLLEQKFHIPALLDLVPRKPNLLVYEYFAQRTIELAKDMLQSSKCRITIPYTESFRVFAVNFFSSSSRVGMNVVLTALVLMHRIDIHALRLYIDSSLEMQPCHLIFLASILVAIKSVDDYPRSSRWFLRCSAGQITEWQLTSYEVEFLKLIGYRVTVSETELVKYYNDIKACYNHHPPTRDYTQTHRTQQTTGPSIRHHPPRPNSTRPRMNSQPTYVQRPQAVRSHVDISHSVEKRPSIPYDIGIPTSNAVVQHLQPAHSGKRRHRKMSTQVPKPHHHHLHHPDYSKTQMLMPIPYPFASFPSVPTIKPIRSSYPPLAKPVIPPEPYITTLSQANKSTSQLTLRRRDGGLTSKIKNVLLGR